MTTPEPATALIVAGRLHLDPADRDAFVRDAHRAVRAARSAPGCLDFALTADSVDPGRVDVYERWASEEALLAFRGSGPDDATAVRILDADVRRYTVSGVGEA
jgi:quinol monooxygenase YgiN